MRFLLPAVVASFALASSRVQADDVFVESGWRMVDRFYGFRFEVEGDVRGGISSCGKGGGSLFGWIQNTARGTVVGEARCSKKGGPDMEARIRKGPSSASVREAHIKVYHDTKIKLHFPDFVVLPDERVTCFQDAPHACGEDERDDTVDENNIWPEGRWPTDDDFEWDDHLFAEAKSNRYEL